MQNEGSKIRDAIKTHRRTSTLTSSSLDVHMRLLRCSARTLPDVTRHGGYEGVVGGYDDVLGKNSVRVCVRPVRVDTHRCTCFLRRHASSQMWTHWLIETIKTVSVNEGLVRT